MLPGDKRKRRKTVLGEGVVMVASARVIEPQAAGPAIDTDHLSRMTLGERSLAREVLALFDRQADILLPRIRTGAPAQAAASAHTLKGSAVGIGAFRVADAAAAVERAKPEDAAIAAAIATLAAMLDEAKAEIARLLAD
jgi:HPt (histidine-containing phosphotransfer) domain-containing protein